MGWGEGQEEGGVSRKGNLFTKGDSDEGGDDGVKRSTVEAKFRILSGLPDGGPSNPVDWRSGLTGMGGGI